jgi:hypothetical protein
MQIMSNPNHETRIDYDAARARLEAVTSDRAVLEGFERLVKNPDDQGAFIAAVGERGMSLDYFLLGEGKPYRGKAVV